MMSDVRLPEIGEYVRMYGTLVEVQDVTPKEIVLDYVFEDTQAKLVGRINGKNVKEYGTFNDFYGKDTCVAAAIDEAKEQQRFLGESNLEFVVIKVTSRVRMRPTRNERENFYASEFRAMESLPNGSCWNLPEDTVEEVWSRMNSTKESTDV